MRKMEMVWIVAALALAVVAWRKSRQAPSSPYSAGKAACASCYFADVL